MSHDFLRLGSRLTAIRSLFRYAAVRHPEHAAVIARVLRIPAKRHDRRAVTFLTAPESQALIDASPPHRWEGRRDRAMLILTLQAGLRVSELIAVNCGDVAFGTGGHVRVEGKGRLNNVPSRSPRRRRRSLPSGLPSAVAGQTSRCSRRAPAGA